MRGELESVPSVGGYLLGLADHDVTLRIERLRRERGQLVGELTVLASLPGVPTTSRGVLHAADFNLSSDRARSERARILASKASAPGLDWAAVLEEFCGEVTGAERHGRPAVHLRDLDRPEAEPFFEVDRGVLLPRQHPAILFGDGGTAKSLLALWWAGKLTRSGVRVLFADWELTAEEHRLRLEQLFGADMPDVLYARCERPMTVEIDRLSRVCLEEGVEYLVADSVAFASDGPPEDASAAAGYFLAVRRLGIGSLHIAHTIKGEGGDAKPFGSVFWHNSARSTWNVKRTTSPGRPSSVSLGLYNRKANLAALAAPVGYEIDFADGSASVRRVPAPNVIEFGQTVSVRAKMRDVLRHRALTVREIAEMLAVPVDTVNKTYKRGEGVEFLRMTGPDGVSRIGLLKEAGHVS